MSLTIPDIEADLQNERLTCAECQLPSRTLPAEGVPAQALRYAIECGHVFFMDLSGIQLPAVN